MLPTICQRAQVDDRYEEPAARVSSQRQLFIYPCHRTAYIATTWVNEQTRPRTCTHTHMHINPLTILLLSWAWVATLYWIVDAPLHDVCFYGRTETEWNASSERRCFFFVFFVFALCFIFFTWSISAHDNTNIYVHDEHIRSWWRDSTRVDEGRKGWKSSSRYKKNQGANHSGEGGEEPAMWPRIWVTATGGREKRRAKIIDGMGKKMNIKKRRLQAAEYRRCWQIQSIPQYNYRLY